MLKITGDIRKAKRFLIILTVVILTFFVGNIIFIHGIFQVPSSEIYINNFDNFEKMKTWSDLKEEHVSLDPRQLSTFWEPPLSLEVYFDSFEELMYPKTVIPIHIKITVDSKKSSLKIPSILVLVLDHHERIRGKTYIQYGSEDFSIKPGQTSEYRYWFKVPDDLQGERLFIIVELFGVFDSSKGINQYELYHSITRREDDFYNELPSWEYYYSNPYFEFLKWTRVDKTAPSTSVLNIFQLSFTASGVISSFFGLLVYFWSKIKTIFKRYPELRMGITFCFLFLIFFFLFIILAVLY